MLNLEAIGTAYLSLKLSEDNYVDARLALERASRTRTDAREALAALCGYEATEPRVYCASPAAI